MKAKLQWGNVMRQVLLMFFHGGAATFLFWCLTYRADVPNWAYAMTFAVVAYARMDAEEQ